MQRLSLAVASKHNQMAPVHPTDSLPGSRDAEKARISESGVELVPDSTMADSTTKTPLPQPDPFEDYSFASSPTPTAITHTIVDQSDLQCCCGRFECMYLKHNSTVLESVEKDVHTAAKLGQALLARHEAYMADAEGERMELNTRIDQLEVDKKELEAENCRTIEENRQLLDQLELLNGAVSDSDLRIRVLEATLQTSQQTIRRLEGAQSRAADMERHLAALEQEQALLQSSLRLTETESRCAMQRWKKAERGISDLHVQLERMEKEGKQERERHVEILGRMERQRAMERELNAAAGRLKGAAAARTMQDSGTGNTTNVVVTHFVRDLLQDNANLQLGIAELREMLIVSNDEIQGLRDQLMYHQPISDEDMLEPFPAGTLDTELRQPQVNQELHIHHHYHVSKAEVGKKARKRNTRQSLSQAIFNPPIVGSLPSTPPAPGSNRIPDSYGTPVQRMRETVSSKPNRWSLLSESKSDFAPSSVPSSPRSNNCNSTIFDRAMMETPGSPTTSIDPMSPSLNAAQRRQSVEVAALNIATIAASGTTTPSRRYRKSLGVHAEENEAENEASEVEEPSFSESNEDSTIIVSQEEAKSIRAIDIPDTSSSLSPFAITFKASSFNPPSTTLPKDHTPRPRRVSRSLSHESIQLVGGMDIHTLSTRPSQLSLRPIGAAVPTTTDVTAHATMLRGSGTALLRSKMYSTVNRRGGRVVSTPVSSTSPSLTGSGGASTPSTPTNSKGIGRWVSWRPWGSGCNTPTGRCVSGPTTPIIRMETDSETQSIHSALSNPEVQDNQTQRRFWVMDAKTPEDDTWRGSGINQIGAIPGFHEYMAYHRRKSAVPHNLVPEQLDLEGLREVLEE